MNCSIWLPAASTVTARSSMPLAVTQVVFRGEHHRLALEAADAPRLAQRDVVMLCERAELLGQQRRKAAVWGAALDLHDFAFGQIAAHGVARAHQLARHPVEHLEPLGVGSGEPGDARDR